MTIEPFDLRQPTPLRPRRRPPDPLVHDQPGVDQEGRDHGRPLRVQQPVGDPVDGEAHVVLRHDAPRHADPGRRGWCRRRATSRKPDLRGHARSATPACSTSARSAAAVGYPLFVKPYDGGGWAGVQPGRRRGRRSTAPTTRAAPTCCTCNEPSSRTTCSCAASASARRPGSCATTRRRRCTTATRWTTADVPDEQRRTLVDTTLTINSFFGWEFNSCEALRQDGDVAPDRLRQRLPRLAGDLAALPLPVAGRRQPALVDLLRRDEAADAGQPRLGAVLRDRRHRRALRARSWPPTRPSPASASRPTSSRRSAPPTSPTSTRSCGSSSATDVARDAVRQKVAALFPAHEVDQFTDLFWERIQRWRGDEPRRGAVSDGDDASCSIALVLRPARARRRRRALGHVRHARCSCSRPPAATPRRSSASTSSTRARELLDAGRVKLYSVDSVNGRVLLAGEGDAGRQAWIQRQFFEFIRHELVPAIRADCASDDIELVAAGSSIGAFNAAGLRVPASPTCSAPPICMSGTYDLRRFFDGPVGDDFVDVVAARTSCRALDGRSTSTACGSASSCWPAARAPTRTSASRGAVAHVLGGKGIPNRVDPWGRSGRTTGRSGGRCCPATCDELVGG